MDKYYIAQDEDGLGKCLVLKSDWSSEYKKIMEVNGIYCIRLSLHGGWEEKELYFMNQLIDLGLKSIEIYSWNINDLSPLYQFKEILSLSIEPSSKLINTFDLSQFNNLHYLFIIWNNKMMGLSKCKNLKRLNVINYPYDSFEEISGMTGLKRLQIESRKLTSLKGISNMHKLSSLELFDCRELDSLDGVEKVKGLKKLEIETCKRINNVDIIGKLENLEELSINNCGAIESIKSLANCKKLKMLLATRDTNVKDGDLSIIKDLPKLEITGFARRRHYNLSRDEINKILDDKKGQVKLLGKD